MLKKVRCIIPAVLGIAALGTQAFAVPCRNNTPSFERWLEGVRQEATAQGISQATVSAALGSMNFDQAIINRDHGQGVFQQSFLQFSDRMVSRDRLSQGPRLMQKHAGLFARIEQQYGVPAPVLVAFWGLESDFGSNNGKYPILRAVTTLAYDCRRPEFFRTQLFDALRIIERGDLRASEMTGDWAGELGGMQMTPSDYYKYAVDFDGDGRRDLVHSIPDTMASAANFLVGLGWRRGEPWLQEVRVPSELPWEQADLSIKHPRAQWARWGLTLADGRALPADDLPASLLLPMGRFGPAFLAYPNFRAFLGWNSAFVYATTAAYLATRLAGAPPIHRGNGTVVALSGSQVLELQQLLAHRGYLSGKVDGKLGLTTRAAVRQAQLKLGMPADSYPTPELLNRLRGL
jgi:lytic murein transglycosylase